MFKNTKIKLIALDIDGTILDSQYRLSEKVKSIVAQAINSGIYVVLATGRMYSATVPIARELGIKTPLITYQGSYVKEPGNNNKPLLHYAIPYDLSLEIIEELRKFAVQINVYIDDVMFVEEESTLLQEYADKRHIFYQKTTSFNEIMEFDSTKILAMHHNPDKVSEVRDYLNAKYSDRLFITKSMPTYCEIVNKEASKGKALLFLAKMWGIESSEIMAIGDQDNDKDMLEVAGLSVAMGNGTDLLKNACDYITETVDNDGAALAIEKFAL